MKTLFFIALLFMGCSKTTVLPVKESTTPEVIVNHNNPYLYMGTATLYPTSEEAYLYRSFGRSYYRDAPILSINTILYQNGTNSQKVSSQNKWVSLTSDNGKTWTSVQLNESGTIISVK